MRKLSRVPVALYPMRSHYLGPGEHLRDSGDAHLKRSLIHRQVVLPVTAGKLDLGPWEQVCYAEFDAQRRKRVVVKVIGE